MYESCILNRLTNYMRGLYEDIVTNQEVTFTSSELYKELSEEIFEIPVDIDEIKRKYNKDIKKIQDK